MSVPLFLSEPKPDFSLCRQNGRHYGIYDRITLSSEWFDDRFRRIRSYDDCIGARWPWFLQIRSDLGGLSSLEIIPYLLSQRSIEWFWQQKPLKNPAFFCQKTHFPLYRCQTPHADRPDKKNSLKSTCLTSRRSYLGALTNNLGNNPVLTKGAVCAGMMLGTELKWGFSTIKV